MLELLLGPPPSAHGQLMLREMCDPTDAMPMIVAEFIEPQTREMEQLVARLLPGAGRETVSQVVFSIIGQVLFYRFTMPMVLLLRRQTKYPRGFARQDRAPHRRLLDARDPWDGRGRAESGPCALSACAGARPSCCRSPGSRRVDRSPC